MGSPGIPQHKKHMLAENQHICCPKRSCINMGSFLRTRSKLAQNGSQHSKNGSTHLQNGSQPPPKWVSTTSKMGLNHLQNGSQPPPKMVSTPPKMYTDYTHSVHDVHTVCSKTKFRPTLSRIPEYRHFGD